MAEEASQVLFGSGTKETLCKLPERTFLSLFEGVPRFTVEKSVLENGVPALDLLSVHSGAFSSKGEARRAIESGGVSVNKEKISAIDTPILSGMLLHGKYLVGQKGKKSYFLITIL